MDSKQKLTNHNSIENILKFSLQTQGIKKDIDKICFNILLQNEISYDLCFLIDEDDTWITFVETTYDGFEKVRVVNKDYICSIEVVYNEELLLLLDTHEKEDYNEKNIGKKNLPIFSHNTNLPDFRRILRSIIRLIIKLKPYRILKNRNSTSLIQ